MTLWEFILRYFISGVAIWLMTFIYAGALYARTAVKTGKMLMFGVNYNHRNFNDYLQETPARTVLWLTVWPYGTIKVIAAYIRFLGDVKKETLNPGEAEG